MSCQTDRGRDLIRVSTGLDARCGRSYGFAAILFSCGFSLQGLVSLVDAAGMLSSAAIPHARGCRHYDIDGSQLTTGGGQGHRHPSPAAASPSSCTVVNVVSWGKVTSELRASGGKYLYPFGLLIATSEKLHGEWVFSNQDLCYDPDACYLHSVVMDDLGRGMACFCDRCIRSPTLSITPRGGSSYRRSVSPFKPTWQK